jgi:hypothetical protein
MKPSIDRFRIAVAGLPIHPGIIDDPEEFAARHGFTDVSVTTRFDKRRRRRIAIIELLPNGALALFLEEIAGRWNVRSISGTAGALLYGHNGRALSEVALIAVLCRIRYFCGKLILENFHDQIIPGESPTSDSYWSLLEIFVQLSDSSGELLRSFRNMRHSKIRNLARYFANKTPSLTGKKVKFIVYDKSAEMASTLEKFKEPVPPPILRFELRLGSAELPLHFNAHNRRRIGTRYRLVKFTSEDLGDVFLNFVGELQGVYFDTSTKKLSAIARFIGQVSRRTGFPTLELAELYAEEKELSAPSLSQLRGDAAKHFAALGNTRVDDVFSAEALSNQPSITVSKLEEAIGDMVERFAFTNVAITRAYTSYGRQDQFVPVPHY